MHPKKLTRQVLISLIGMLLTGCGPQHRTDNLDKHESIQSDRIAPVNNSLTVTENDTKDSQRIVQRFFPEEIETTEFGTIISESNLKISIQSRFLDSYVIDEFESEGTKYIDKFRDSEKYLVVRQANEIIIDTVFKKNDFAEYAGQDFLRVAGFHGYWFSKIKNDTIEFFGVIIKPDTDWSFTFYHYFDIKTRRFKVVKQTDQEI